MKINWGTGIAIFYITFVIALVSVVIYSFNNTVDLVQPDYYHKDINYEKFRQKRENGSESPLEVVRKDKQISLVFPTEMAQAKGTVTLFRPSNKKLDTTYKLKLDAENKMQIDISAFPRGLWKLQTDWEKGGKFFYNEKKLVF